MAQIYIARKQNVKAKNVIGINIQDDKTIIDIEMSLEDFAKAVTGLSSECKYEVGKIGED